MRIKLLLICAAILSCTISFAQFTQGKSKAMDNTHSSWNSFYLQYNSIGTNWQAKNADEIGLYGWKDYARKEYLEKCLKDRMNGMTIGYSHTSRVFPIWLEYGGALQYGWYSDSGVYHDAKFPVRVKLSMLTFTAPISVLYNYKIPNSNIGLEPKVGLYFRYNIYGKIDVEESEKSANVTEYYNINIFDEDIKGKRLQLGLHAGFNITYKNYFIGISYGSDLSKIYDGYADVKLNQTSVTAGFRF